MARGPLDLRGSVTITDRGSATLRRLQGRIAGFARRSGLTEIARQGTQVARSVGTATAALGRLVVPLAGLGSIAGLGGLAGIGLAIKGFASEGDELAKFARQVGFAAQSLRELQFVADRQGVDQALLSSSLTALTKRMGELKAETGGLYTFLKKTNPALLAQLKTVQSSEEAFGLMLGALNDMENAQDRNALAAAAFSRSGIALTRIAEAGSEGIADLRQQFRHLAGELEDLDFSNAENFMDKMSNIGTALKGFRDAVAKDVLPLLSPMIGQLTEWIAANRALLATNITGFVKDLATGIKSVDWVGVFGSIQQTVASVKGLIDAVGGFKTIGIAFAALLAGPFVASIIQVGVALSQLALILTTTPIGQAALVIGGAAALIMADWASFKPFFQDTFSSVKSMAEGLGLDRILQGQVKVDFNKITTGFRNFDIAVTGIFNQLGTTINNWARDTFGIDFQAKLKGAFEGVAQAWGSALEGIKGTLAEWVASFKATFVQPILNLINRIANAWAAVSSAFSGSGVPHAQPDGSRSPLVGTARAHGGPVRRGYPYVVGDGGRPEMFVPDQNGRILPHVPQEGLLSRAARAGAVGGGSSVPSVGQRTRATLDINMRGAPEGTSVKYAESGDTMFDTPRFNMGRTMTPARSA